MKLSACAAIVKLAANERKMIAVRALAGTEPVSTLAARHGVSRPLVYRQMHKASAALVEHIKDVNVATIKSSTRDFVRPDSVVSHTQYGFAGREIKSSLRS
ncbi:hypothetical protein [Paraburkholderia sediminicola]|uniref:hypothetical protein n=1 Tax=Paraburkholderia sediminicola TaxID=458836 RepID=UPI0038BD06D2